MLTVIKKLPYRLRDKWRSVACDIQETCQRRATFPDIVSFIERRVRVHPNMLHIHPKNKDQDRDHAGVADAVLWWRCKVVVLLGAGYHDCKRSIVPVKVKSKRGHKVVKTYAFLDQGSSGSFCTLCLMKKLNISGRGTKIFFRTVGQEKLVRSCVVSDLEVAGLESDLYSDLPDVFTQKKMQHTTRTGSRIYRIHFCEGYT